MWSVTTDHHATRGEFSKLVNAAARYVIQAASANESNQIMGVLYYG